MAAISSPRVAKGSQGCDAGAGIVTRPHRLPMRHLGRAPAVLRGPSCRLRVGLDRGPCDCPRTSRPVGDPVQGREQGGVPGGERSVRRGAGGFDEAGVFGDRRLRAPQRVEGARQLGESRLDVRPVGEPRLGRAATTLGGVGHGARVRGDTTPLGRARVRGTDLGAEGPQLCIQGGEVLVDPPLAVHRGTDRRRLREHGVRLLGPLLPRVKARTRLGVLAYQGGALRVQAVLGRLGAAGLRLDTQVRAVGLELGGGGLAPLRLGVPPARLDGLFEHAEPLVRGVDLRRSAEERRDVRASTLEILDALAGGSESPHQVDPPLLGRAGGADGCLVRRACHAVGSVPRMRGGESRARVAGAGTGGVERGRHRLHRAPRRALDFVGDPAVEGGEIPLGRGLPGAFGRGVALQLVGSDGAQKRRLPGGVAHVDQRGPAVVRNAGAALPKKLRRVEDARGREGARGPRVEAGEAGALVGRASRLVEHDALAEDLLARAPHRMADRPPLAVDDRRFEVALAGGEQRGERAACGRVTPGHRGERQLEEQALALADVPSDGHQGPRQRGKRDLDRVLKGPEARETQALQAHRPLMSSRGPGWCRAPARGARCGCAAARPG